MEGDLEVGHDNAPDQNAPGMRIQSRIEAEYKTAPDQLADEGWQKGTFLPFVMSLTAVILWYLQVTGNSDSDVIGPRTVLVSFCVAVLFFYQALCWRRTWIADTQGKMNDITDAEARGAADERDVLSKKAMLLSICCRRSCIVNLLEEGGVLLVLNGFFRAIIALSEFLWPKSRTWAILISSSANLIILAALCFGLYHRFRVYQSGCRRSEDLEKELEARWSIRAV